MSRVRILTDSTSDIPAEVAERLDIVIVPAYVQFDNRSYRDGSPAAGLSREQFYAQLPGMSSVPTTSVAPTHEFAAAYHALDGEADEVIAILISSNLSSMYDVAQMAAEDVPELKIHFIDSGQVTMGLGWMVIAAAEAAAEGKSAQEILSLVEDMKPRVHVYAMLDTLEYLRRSGRVSWARAKAAQILRIKPIVEVILGTVKELGRARTRRRAIERLVELTHAMGPLERLAILHTCAPEVENLRRHLGALCGSECPPVVVVTTIIGAHVGPLGLGVAAVTTQ